MASLATVADLEVRLGLAPGSLAGNDLARAQAALDDVSEVVRTAGRRSWTADTIPSAAKVIVLAVAKRVYNNPDNYTSESAGDYSYQADQKAVGLTLTIAEEDIVQASALQVSDDVTAWRGVGSVRTPSPYGRPPLHIFGRDDGTYWRG